MLLRPAHQRQLLRRTAACFKRTSVAGSGLPRVRHKHTQSSGSSSSSSDAELRAVFDDLSLWTSIATSRRSAAANNTAKGLFGHDHLRAPADLSRLTEATMVKANTLVRRICDLPSTFAKEATSREDALLVTSIQFDRLSDLLCSVIDPCEAIRNVVSQPDWKLAAERTYAELCEYMNILNTHTGLYEVIKAVLDPFDHVPADPQLYAAYQVSLQFLRDFEQSGIHLPDRAKRQFVSLNNDILQHSWNFITSSASSSGGIEQDTGDLGLDASAPASDPLYSGAAGRAFLTSPSARTRRDAWIGQHSHPTAVRSLEALLKARLDLARLLGYQSYAQLALRGKMAHDPDSVWRFLDSTNAANQKASQSDVHYLAKLRGLDTVKPWDREYCSMVVPAPKGPPLSPFFSVGTCVQGLSRLFESLFGVSLHFTTAEGEWLWDDQVRRMEVRDESGRLLGSIYMDLFARDGKASNAAHYTVQCARKLSWDDEAGDGPYTLPEEQDAVTLRSSSSSRSSVQSGRQLPMVVLSFDFDQRSRGPTTLLWQQVETLFHEMGHAIHSMLGQTDFQNVSGTRCATDFVELPSILMEHFCASPQVLGLYARHHATDAPLPLSVFESHQSSHSRLQGLEQSHQISLSALDMAYHTQTEEGERNWTTQTAWQVLDQYGPPGSAAGRDTGVPWQMGFTHLASYGATYYSYLLDRAMARKVWDHLFARNGGLSREAGELYRAQVLQWGGGKDPWHCMADVLEMDQLRDGGSKAMSAVGH